MATFAARYTSLCSQYEQITSRNKESAHNKCALLDGYYGPDKIRH